MTAGAQQSNVVGYNKDLNTLTTVHYYYGSVDNITVAGDVQTTIKLGGQGLPTEVTNDYATVALSWAGTRSVTVTQTVNGQTKTDKLDVPDGVVVNYRAEYQKYKQNPSTLDKIDQFLAGGGAKLVGGIIGTISDMLENPIGACFDQALEAAKASEKSIIPIRDLQTLQMASNLNKSVADRVKDAAVNKVFENYQEWTNEWSDMVYKWQMEKYSKQKADNRTEQQWRLELANTLLSNGKSLKEAAKIIEEVSKQRDKGGANSKGGNGAANGKGNGSGNGNGNGGGGKGSSGNGGSGNGGSGNGGGGNGGGGNGGSGNGGNGNNGGDDYGKRPHPDADFDVVGYVKDHYKNDKRGLPPEMIAEWVRYKVWGYHRMVNYKLNSDKKTYTQEVIMEGGEHNIDEYDEPEIYVSFNGPGNWGVEPGLHIPLPKKKK